MLGPLSENCPRLTLRTQSLLAPVPDFGTFLGGFWSQFCSDPVNLNELWTLPRNKKTLVG
jgi:hypothetical protein